MPFPNETLRLLNERCSVRNFRDQEIEPEIIDLLMLTASNAPSGGNNQPVSIIKIRDKETREKLAEMCWQPFIGKAPLNLLFCLDLHRNEMLADYGDVPYTAGHSFRHFWISFQDTLIAAQNVCTAADALGLGSCYIGSIMEHFDACVEMFLLPKLVVPVVLVVIGYPAAEPKYRKKFSPEVMVHDERYQPYDAMNLYAKYSERENDHHYELNERNTDTFHAVCRGVKGKEYADELMERIKKRGWLSPIQRLYGLHYLAATMPLGNGKFIESLKSMGIDWFDEWNMMDDTEFVFEEQD